MKNKSVTTTLDPENQDFPKALISDTSLVVSDIDYTLLDFGQGHRAGIQGIRGVLGGKLAGEVNEMFHVLIEGARWSREEPWEKRDFFDAWVDRIAELEQAPSSKFGLKVWSREAWILIAAEKHRVPLDAAKVEEAREAYWRGVSEKSSFYPDAERFLEWLYHNQKPVVLMTASDSVVKVKEDLSLEYDPEYSRSHKEKRLSRFFGDSYPLVIGDPIDKPDPRFFENVFAVAGKLGEHPSDQILVIGDSERNDLEYPRQLGCRTLRVVR